MRCIGYCTAESFDISRLFQSLQPAGAVQPFRDVIHVQSKDEKGIKRDLFYFAYGVVLFWGFTEEEEREVLRSLKGFEAQPLPKPELDEFTFSYGDKMTKIQDDEIVLHKKDPLTKLSLSYAIGQSLKLTVFEEAILRTINHSKKIPRDLAEKGKITLSRKQISRTLGELYLERNYINLNTEILDTPEFFWEHSELEPFYRRVTHYLDVNKRVDLLNRRLMLLHELFEILENGLNHRHSVRLEWTIIILIIIEVVLSILRDLLHWI